MKLDETNEALKRGEIVHAGERVLCAVSGGADSVALLAIMRDAADAAGYELCAAHVHHGIRAESDEELEFVRGLCRQLGVPLYVHRADVPALAQQSGEGIESAARRVRYDFFYSAAREHGCTLIALAHHSRDQAETVLMHALRGASVSGLCGMRPRAGMLVRPLLDVAPEELRAYLAEHGLEFREDASNADTRYTRNYVRHVILPACERAYPGSREGLCRLARSAALDDDFIERAVDAAASGCLCEYPGGLCICVEKMSRLHPAIQARIAARAMRATGQDAEYAGIQRILAAIQGEAATLPGGVRVSRGARRVYLELPDRGAPDYEVMLPAMCELPVELSIPGGKVRLEKAARDANGGFEHGDGRHVQTLDAEALSGAVLRVRRTGDEIYPLGAHGHKKFKDYLIDHKVDRQVRDYLPVLARGNRIIWALGVGVARDAALSGQTHAAVTLRWDGNGIW